MSSFCKYCVSLMSFTKICLSLILISTSDRQKYLTNLFLLKSTITREKPGIGLFGHQKSILLLQSFGLIYNFGGLFRGPETGVRRSLQKYSILPFGFMKNGSVRAPLLSLVELVKASKPPQYLSRSRPGSGVPISYRSFFKVIGRCG